MHVRRDTNTCHVVMFLGIIHDTLKINYHFNARVLQHFWVTDARGLQNLHL